MRPSVSQIYFVIGILSLITALSVPLLARFLPRRWTHSLAVSLYVLAAVLGMIGGKATAFALFCNCAATSIAFVCFNANVLKYIDKQELSRLESMRLLHAGLGWAGCPFVGVWLLQFWSGAPFVVVVIAAIAMLSLIWLMRMGSTECAVPIGAVSSNPFRYLRRFLAQPRLVAGWFLVVTRAAGESAAARLPSS
jgi:MFS transporter, ACDE family, multidrug resistance protein